MSRLYVTWKEDEAYRDGYRDASLGAADGMRQNRSFCDYDSPDKAYWDGQDDYLKEQAKKRREEDYWNEQYKESENQK